MVTAAKRQEDFDDGVWGMPGIMPGVWADSSRGLAMAAKRQEDFDVVVMAAKRQEDFDVVPFGGW